MKHYNLIDKAFLLKRSSLFDALDLDLLLTISDKLEVSHYKEGEIVFSAGLEANRMYLIVEGEVSIEHEGKSYTLKGGEFFGDEALFNERPRAYKATAKNALFLLTLSRNHILSIIEECPSVGIALLTAYTKSQPFRTR